MSDANHPILRAVLRGARLRPGLEYEIPTGPRSTFHYALPKSGPGSLLARLQAEFPSEVLDQSGIVDRGRDGKTTLTEALTIPCNRIYALRDPDNCYPIELLSEAGIVGGKTLPVFSQMERSHDVLAAFNLDDMAVLRSWGCQATLATGLESLTPPDVIRLSEAFGSSYKENREKEERSAAAVGQRSGHRAGRSAIDIVGATPNRTQKSTYRELKLVGWSPARMALDVPVQLDFVTTQFLKMYEFQNANLDNVAVWKPHPSELEKFRHLVKWRDLDNLSIAIAESLEGYCYDAVEWSVPRPAPPPPPANLSEALDHLLSLHRAPHPVLVIERIPQAWATFERFLKRDIVGPLLKDAARAAEPVERSLRTLHAETSRLWHQRSAAFQILMVQLGKRPATVESQKFEAEKVRELMRLSDQTMRLSREIFECENRCAPRTIPFPRPTSAAASHSPSSRSILPIGGASRVKAS